MNEKIDVLKMALKDPTVPNPQAAHCSGNFVSVWSYEGMARQRIEYRIHSPELGQQLKAIHDTGFESGRPRLCDVYTPKDLCGTS